MVCARRWWEALNARNVLPMTTTRGTKFDPNVVPAEWTGAVMRAMTRHRFGPLAASLNNETIIAIAKEATAVMGEVWSLVVAEVAEGKATIGKAAIGDTVTATLRGKLTDYDRDLGIWTLVSDGSDHVPWTFHLHWAQPFEVVEART